MRLVRKIEEPVKLKVYLLEGDKVDGVPAVDWILERVRELGLRGATVHRCFAGCGRRGRSEARILRTSMNLPVVVEVVDSREKVERLLELLKERLGVGVVTLERLEVAYDLEG